MAYKYCCKRRDQSRVPGSPSRCRGPWADVMRAGPWLQGTLSLDCVWPLNSRTCGTCSVTTRTCSVDGAQMQGYGASNGQCNSPGLVESRGCGKMPSPFGGDWWHGTEGQEWSTARRCKTRHRLRGSRSFRFEALFGSVSAR